MNWCAGALAAALLVGIGSPTLAQRVEQTDFRESHDHDRGSRVHDREFHDRGFRFHDHDGFHHRFHDHDRFFFGGNIFVPDAYPYGYYPYAPPPVWYWCGNPAGYYPYVARCFLPWQPVPGQ